VSGQVEDERLSELSARGDDAEAGTVFSRVRAAVASVVIGNEDPLEWLLVAMLCHGHALLEDVPGVGKTVLARSLAKTLGATFRRIQFTPDVLPSDITGSNVFNQKTSEFEFRPGPLFTQVLLADEINRATPRAQAALLEAMQERQVTVDGHTTQLAAPFLVLATQNPIELEGTFPLPEAQLDRFLVRVPLGYPSLEEEHAILQRFEHDDPLERVEAVTGPEEIVSLQARRGNVYISEAVREYLLEIVRSTRTDERLVLGASPRAAMSLHWAVQARAMLHDRSFGIPDDVKTLAVPVLAHRVALSTQARLRHEKPEAIIRSLVDKATVPVEEGWPSVH
jgi:MoxR-like ATPase